MFILETKSGEEMLVNLPGNTLYVNQSAHILSARNLSWHSLQSISGSEKLPRCPLATHVCGFIRIAQSTPTSFRNEITPGNFIFRVREFEQMEMEFFCEPDTDLEWFAYWKKYCIDFLKRLTSWKGAARRS